MLFVQWFRRTYPGVLIFSIPNGGHRHMAVAAKMKLTGTLAGIPDLFIPAWRTFVEMKKSKNGRVSTSQKEVIPNLEACGYRVIIAHGWAEAVVKITTA